jgi:N-acetylglutamate synthase-like GNAT family acetyltransferase
MNDRIVEEARGALYLTTDRTKIDVDVMLALLRASHWASSMTRPMLERAIEHSVCFSVFDGNRQLGFARAISDLTTYAYLTDVIVAEDARGQGIGRWLMEAIVAHPDLQGLRRIALWTRDAPWLYEKFGFTTDMPASTYMELRARR